MDILIHTLSGGITASSLALGQTTFSTKRKIGTSILGCFAGAFPDLDAISLWSKFDHTIGDFFNLQHSGRYIYSAKFWYSHHAFLHSIIAAILFSLVVVGMISIFYRRKENIWLIPILFFSFSAHLIGDLPTPASNWGGINLWFPAHQYTGGWGWTWWWNNYDIFLILLIGVLLNGGFIIYKHFFRLPIWTGIATLLLACSLITFQLTHRGFDFAYGKSCPDYQGYEVKSKQIQKKILGESLYNLMVKFDQKLPVLF